MLLVCCAHSTVTRPGRSTKGVQLWDPCGRKGGEHREPPPNVKGRLFGIAAMVLMTFMYQARTARFDAQKPINFMAKRISCWDMTVDQHLHRLVCYLHWSQNHTQIGWIGDPARLLGIHLFLDADFAGCPYTLKSSSGCHLDVQGPNSSFPLSAGSSGQTATAQSSTSAETCAMGSGVRSKGDPSITMGSFILGKFHEPGDDMCGGSTAHNRDCMFMDHRKLGYPDGDGPGVAYIQEGGSDETEIPKHWVPRIIIREDNTTCISTNLSGKNGQMKELERAFGVYVSWNCARLNSGDYETLYTRSHDMTADISTKGFDDAALYARLSLLMNYTRCNSG